MTRKISSLAQVDPRASLGDDVEIGPFCVVGPDVTLGDRTKLDSNVVIVGHVIAGSDNRFHPGAVIGGEPQDHSYCGGPTQVEIGNGNVFREGATVSRGAEKDETPTRIGNNNMFMANSHVAHNCCIENDVILVNGVLLGGHVHIQDGVIVSGNSAIHHFTTLGTLCFIAGCSRVTIDVAPYMMWAGVDDGRVRTINVVGMRRRGISSETIQMIKRVQRLCYRQHKPIEAVRAILQQELGARWPEELTALVNFINTRGGRNGRQREAAKAA